MIVTCLTETVDWSISKETINYLNSYYKAWSKAGIGTGMELKIRMPISQALVGLKIGLKIIFLLKLAIIY